MSSVVGGGGRWRWSVAVVGGGGGGCGGGGGSGCGCDCEAFNTLPKKADARLNGQDAVYWVRGPYQ